MSNSGVDNFGITENEVGQPLKDKISLGLLDDIQYVTNEAIASLIHMPNNVVEGKLSVRLMGDTRTNLAPTNPNDWEQGYISLETGAEFAETNSIRTKSFIQVNPSTQYSFKVENTYNIIIFEYDVNNVYLGFIPKFTSGTITTRSNTAKIKIRLRKDNSNSIVPTEIINGCIIMETGTTIGNLITGTKSTLPTRVKSVGKNLFDAKNITFGSVIIADPGQKVFFNDNTNRLRTPKAIKVLPNTQYRIRNTKGFAFYTVETNDLNIVQRTLNFTNDALAFTTTATTTQVYVIIKNSTSTTMAISDVEDANIQLEQGSAYTTYEPYTFTESYFNTPDNQPLRSLPNGIRDEINDKGELVRRIGNKTLQASDIIGFDESTNFRQFYTSTAILDDYINKSSAGGLIFSNIKVFGRTQILSNQGSKENHIDSYFIANGKIYFVFSKETTLEQARIILTGQELNYQLKNPVTTPLSVSPVYAFNQGTVVIEPYINQALKHNGTSIALSYAVSSVDSITDLDGTPITTFTLSADGKTLTFTGVNNAFYRVIAPIRKEESTTPTIIYSAPLNRVLNNRDLMRIDSMNQQQQLQIDMLLAQTVEVGKHQAETMPHKTADGGYNWNARVNVDSSITFIFEEVV